MHMQMRGKKDKRMIEILSRQKHNEEFLCSKLQDLQKWRAENVDYQEESTLSAQNTWLNVKGCM